jgi:hypothetical protein
MKVFPKATGYLVNFTLPGSTRVPRFRRVTDAANDEQAIEAALKGTRPGALKRFAAIHGEIGAHVVRPGDPIHENGRPMMMHGYLLSLHAH